MSAATRELGRITYDEQYGHVCTCTREVHSVHPRNADPYWHEVYRPTVEVVRSVEPTDSGSYWYVCSRCGAGGWSGL